MSIKGLWYRLTAKFRKNRASSEEAHVMELVPDQAPEPVPDRKTSDEMIVEMAEKAGAAPEAAEKAGSVPEAEKEAEAASETTKENGCIPETDEELYDEEDDYVGE